MGGCCSKNRTPIRHTYVSSIRHTYISSISTIKPNIISTHLDATNDSSDDISCNFVYEEWGSIIAAVLAIVLVSIQDEYEICCICTDKIATIKSIICKHSILCTGCYRKFCDSEQTLCPICRMELDSNNPFII